MSAYYHLHLMAIRDYDLNMRIPRAFYVFSLPRSCRDTDDARSSFLSFSVFLEFRELCYRIDFIDAIFMLRLNEHLRVDSYAIRIMSRADAGTFLSSCSPTESRMVGLRTYNGAFGWLSVSCDVCSMYVAMESPERSGQPKRPVC